MKTSKEEQIRLFEMGKKRCSKCQDIVDIQCFPRKNQSRYGVASVCKKCKQLKTDEWKNNNLQRVRSNEKARREKLRNLKIGKGSFGQGYIYVFRWENFVKIGISINPASRIRTLDVGLPTKGKLIHLIKTNNMIDAEKIIHDKFSHARKRGEWFSLSENDLEYLQSINYIDTNYEKT